MNHNQEGLLDLLRLHMSRRGNCRPHLSLAMSDIFSNKSMGSGTRIRKHKEHSAKAKIANRVEKSTSVIQYKTVRFLIIYLSSMHILDCKGAHAGDHHPLATPVDAWKWHQPDPERSENSCSTVWTTMSCCVWVSMSLPGQDPKNQQEALQIISVGPTCQGI